MSRIALLTMSTFCASGTVFAAVLAVAAGCDASHIDLPGGAAPTRDILTSNGLRYRLKLELLNVVPYEDIIVKM